MKKIFFIVIFYIHPILLFSQSDNLKTSRRLVFNVGIENLLPIGNFAQFYNYGLGISAEVEYKLSPDFSFTFDPGVINYFYNTKSVNVTGSTSYLTLLGGGRYYFPYKIFIDGQIGLAEKIDKEQKEKALAFGGSAGIYLNKKITAEFKYIKIKSITSAPETIGLRIGYTF